MCATYDAHLRTSGVEDLHDLIDPTRAESIRISRAICRLEVFCITLLPFTRTAAEDSDTDPDPFFNKDEIVNLFCHRLMPWELEEMVCVFDFLKVEYSKIFDKMIGFISKNPTKEWMLKLGEGSGPDAFKHFDIRPEGTKSHA